MYVCISVNICVCIAGHIIIASVNSILFCFAVKAKFGVATENVALVLERDGSVVEPDFEMLSHLSAAKETLMVLVEGETWTSSVLEVSCFKFQNVMHVGWSIIVNTATRRTWDSSLSIRQMAMDKMSSPT
jgi:hypothetical protein